ncbi:MAG: FG-GAP repeat domain-containing protein [Akkermansiaceae bacterium]
MKYLVFPTLFNSVAGLLIAAPQAYAEDVSPPQSWQKHSVVQKQNTAMLSVTAGDFTGDGLPDVVSSYNGQVLLFTAPTWSETVLYTFDSKKERCIASVAVDVDNDGDLDWIGAGARTDVLWLENPSKPQADWKSRIIDADIGALHSIIAADVNNDGKQNLIINNFIAEGDFANSAMWYEIPSNPQIDKPWKRHIFAQGDAPGGSHYFAFGDIDGDGWGEIALSAKGQPFDHGNWYAYWKNPGREQIEQPWEKVKLLSDQTGATNILIADINDDQNNDFIIANGHGTGVFWLKAPDFNIQVIDDKMRSAHSLAVADFDHDGDIDVASCGFESKRLSVYSNDGSGMFKRTDLDLDQESYDLITIDMDLDGDLDLLNAGRKSANVSWYENPHQ